ncbi:MAG: hypothetical protein ACTTIC_05360 [Helicobacteraceae bacterium]
MSASGWLQWLENLNLRGDYKAVIMNYIKQKHPQLLPLYREIYYSGKRAYWLDLDAALRSYAGEIWLETSRIMTI